MCTGVYKLRGIMPPCIADSSGPHASKKASIHDMQDSSLWLQAEALAGSIQQAGGVLPAGKSFFYLLGTLHVLLLRKAW